MNTRPTSFGFTFGVFLTVAAAAIAQTPAPQGPAALALTAVSANVNGAGEKIDLFINKWSGDADRDRLVAAWSVTPAPAGSAARGAAGRAGDAAAAEAAPAAGGGGRGGRGRGGGNAPAAPRTPEAALTAAMKELPTVGYFWTSEVGGYLIRYACQVPESGGGSRIILLTDKRLGAAKNNWRATAPATPNTYEFTLIELRLPAKGPGTGKASITGTIVVDPETKNLGLGGYDALPVTLQDIKHRPNS